MKHYKVIFEIHYENGTKAYKDILVEAGNRKTAAIRAMGVIGKIEEYKDLFKNIKSIEEVAA